MLETAPLAAEHWGDAACGSRVFSRMFVIFPTSVSLSSSASSSSWASSRRWAGRGRCSRRWGWPSSPCRWGRRRPRTPRSSAARTPATGEGKNNTRTKICLSKYEKIFIVSVRQLQWMWRFKFIVQWIWIPLSWSTSKGFFSLIFHLLAEYNMSVGHSN